MTISTGTPIPTGLPTTATPAEARAEPTAPTDRAAQPSAGPGDPEGDGATVLPGRRDADVDTDTDTDADDGADTGPVPRLRVRLPGMPGPGLTVAGGTVLGAALVLLGAALDLSLGGGLGLGFRVTFVVTCVLVACALRVRALASAVVLPPLLYAAAATLQTVAAGQTSGRRAAALDVATTLALSAPTLFLGTGIAAAVAVSRGLAHLVRR